MNWLEVTGDKGMPAILNSDTLFCVQCAEDGAAIAISIGGAFVKLDMGYVDFVKDLEVDQGEPAQASTADMQLRHE